MIDRLLHTPEGVRDIYNAECAAKLKVEEWLHDVIGLFGFQDIQTPTFEYFDMFSRERGTVASKDIYKFFDREGNTLVLRPDVTPSIARCIAKYFREEELPIRLCYSGNTFINTNEYQGKLKESTQFGAELINDASVEADAEMLALTIACLQKAGLKEFQVEVGQVEFFKALIEEAGFEAAETEQLRTLIVNKNSFGMEDLLSGKNLSKELLLVLLRIPELFGTMDRLEEIRKMTGNKRALKAIDRLGRLYELMKCYGMEQFISFDLGMLSKYEYYTGVIFHAYTYGTGDTIVSGGRYDSLVGQFGKDAPAIGVAILVDQLMLALTRQKLLPALNIEGMLLLYVPEMAAAAIEIACGLREKGNRIELLRYVGGDLEPFFRHLLERSLHQAVLLLNDGKQYLLNPNGTRQELY